MKTPAFFIKDFGHIGDGAAVAWWGDRRIGMIVPWHARGPHRFAWSFNGEGAEVRMRLATNSASARADLTRHFFEWLYVTTSREAAETVRGAA